MQLQPRGSASASPGEGFTSPLRGAEQPFDARRIRRNPDGTVLLVKTPFGHACVVAQGPVHQTALPDPQLEDELKVVGAMVAGLKKYPYSGAGIGAVWGDLPYSCVTRIVSPRSQEALNSVKVQEAIRKEYEILVYRRRTWDPSQCLSQSEARDETAVFGTLVRDPRGEA